MSKQVSIGWIGLGKMGDPMTSLTQQFLGSMVAQDKGKYQMMS